MKRGRIREYAERFKSARYFPDTTPWQITCFDCAFPSATQNEITGEDARVMLKNGCQLVAEGANMPSTPEAVDLFLAHKVLFGPAKAANAGGVAVSGLEMSQNSMRLQWSREEVDRRLREIMVNIHRQCRETAEAYERPGNLLVGANIAAFVKVADAMLDQGLV